MLLSRISRPHNLNFPFAMKIRAVRQMLNNGHFVDRGQAVAHGVQVMGWLEENYFSEASYLKMDNRAVLLCFGPQFFTHTEWELLLANLASPPHFFSLKFHDAPKIGEFDWPVPGDGTVGVIANLNTFYSRAASYGWESFIAGAFPRFHDIYEQAGVGSSYGFIDNQEGLTYEKTLEAGLLSDASVIQVITWNDYGEGTGIEPTEEDGYLYLEITQELKKEYVDPLFPYAPADLRLPIKLYKLRKEHFSNPDIMTRLDAAESHLFNDLLRQAELLMEQVDCIAAIASDFNTDCKVNLIDLERLSHAWVELPGRFELEPGLRHQ